MSRYTQNRMEASHSGGGQTTLAEILLRHRGGPQTGIFTDGSASPNPGPGGWGVVQVKDGQVLAQKHGHVEATTNNQMELIALIEAYALLPTDAEVDVFTDSQLAVKTVTEWAPGWERRGWRRSNGAPIKNLELVQRLVALAKERPLHRLQWLRGHAGSLWNEYADGLATAWRRETL